MQGWPGMSSISKPFLSPLHRVFHRRLCCSEGWIANCQFNHFPPTPALGHKWMSWHRMQSCYSCFFSQTCLCLGEKKKYGCISAPVAVIYEVISFSKTDFINAPLLTNIGKIRFVFFSGIGPGFVWISVCAGRG